MKRLLSILVILLMVVSLFVACGKPGDNSETGQSDTNASDSTTETEDLDDTAVAPEDWFGNEIFTEDNSSEADSSEEVDSEENNTEDDNTEDTTEDTTKEDYTEEYGTLTIKLPARILTGYPAVEIKAVFSKPEKAEALTFTSSVDKVKIENGKVYVTASTNVGYVATITAKSEHFEAKARIYVETYQGSSANGSSLNLESQITVRKNQISSQSKGETEDMVLFVGDSFFNPDNWWTSFYSDYAKKKAYTVGISSTTTEDWQIISEKLVYPYSPKAVVVHCGTNDIFDDKDSGATTAESLIKLFNTYHERMPDTKIYWFNIEPRVNKSFTEPDAANKAVAQFAEGKDWLVVIDSASWCFNSDGSVDSAFFKDGVHPANEKYALYMQALTDAGLVIDNKSTAVNGNSFPDVIRDKSQAIGNAPASVTYNGQQIVNEYVVTGKFTLTDVGNNPHAEFQFSTYKYRFLIRDYNDNGKFGVCWSLEGATNEEGYEEYTFGSTPLTLEWKLVFTAKNAYLYINGELKAVYYNVPNPQHLYLSTEKMSATFSDIMVYTKSGDPEVYNEALAAVSAYEAQTETTPRVVRVG